MVAPILIVICGHFRFALLMLHDHLKLAKSSFVFCIAYQLFVEMSTCEVPSITLLLTRVLTLEENLHRTRKTLIAFQKTADHGFIDFKL